MRYQRCPIRSTCFALGFVVMFGAIASGQSLRGSITGSVKDDSAGALPGVTVTVTSPALQVPQIVRVTDERGEYQIRDLNPGSYRVSYELNGFSTLVREGIVLTTGFAARVDVVLKVATLAETITVSGASPVVDPTSTRGGTTVSKELLASVPGNANYADMLLLVGGVQTAITPPQTGQIGPAYQGMSGKSYGAGTGMNMMEGIRMMPNESPDFQAFEEIDVKTFGNTAEIDVPGVVVQLVAKSGGNEFHGRFNEIYQDGRFESDNIDDGLRAQGISTGDSVVRFNDISGDLGGRIIRDKLWFYGAVRDMRNKRTISGYAKAPGPDGRYATADDIPGEPTSRHNSFTTKISYQPTANNRFVGFWQNNPDYDYQRGDRFTPLESTMHLNQYSQETKPVEWLGTLSNRLIVNMAFGKGGYVAKWHFNCHLAPGCSTSTPSTFDRATSLVTGPGFSSPPVQRRPNRKQLFGSVNYLPERSFLGSHDIKTGYRFWWSGQPYRVPNDPDTQAGMAEYRLVYDTIGGVAHQPAEIHVRNAPVSGTSGQNSYAVYLQDTWRPATRVTLNLGLRWERQVHFVDEQVKVQGTFGTSGTFPAVDAGQWNRLAPRIGVAFDLYGTGRTVLKSTYGWFNDDLAASNAIAYSQAFSQNSLTTYVYRWTDPTGCNCYALGSVNLDVNGPAFVSVSGATNNVVNPDMKLPHTHEVTASLEHEVGQGASLRTVYVFKQEVDAFTGSNVLRPYDVYNQQFNRQDPGPDGVLNTADDGGIVTFFDYDPAYRGAAFVSNMNINAGPDRKNSYHSIEGALTKRSTGKWFAETSLLATKNHQWLIGVSQSPNDDLNNLNATWDLTYRLAAGYTLPHGFNVSTLYQAYSGLQRQRTVIFRTVDPAGGPRLPSSSTITVRTEPYGATRGPARSIANIRIAKDIALGGGRKVTLGLDTFNAFNSNVPWGRPPVGATATGPSGIIDISGPTYGYVVRVVTPRVLRFGLGYHF